MSYSIGSGGIRHKLDTLIKYYFDHDAISFKDLIGSGKDKKTFQELSIKEAGKYAAEDADMTLRLWKRFKSFMVKDKQVKIYEIIEKPLAQVIMNMEKHGISIDVNKLADIYLRFYPLLQEAYQDLGYPDAYFNARLIDVIDHLLATPEVNDPIILHRPNILFEFVHPELESLSSGQKLLIRTGKRHSSRIKQFIKEFRALIS